MDTLYAVFVLKKIQICLSFVTLFKKIKKKVNIIF